MDNPSLLSSNSNSNPQTAELEEGRAIFKERYSPINAWAAAHGSDLPKTSSMALAFNIAQPTWMIIGYIIVFVFIGLMLLIGFFDSELYNSDGYKLMMFFIPIGIFIGSWFIQAWSNARKDNTFTLLVQNYNRPLNAINFNAV